MPKVESYTPPWLSRPSPGAKVFSSSRTTGLELSSADQNRENARPTRTLAARGSEVLTVVDNEIRWSNLGIVKDDWKDLVRAKENSEAPGFQKGCEDDLQHYRVCH